MPDHSQCTKVTPQCPVEATTLGYYPNLGVNIFFVVAYSICAIVTLTIGLWKRTWVFGLVVAAGFFLETCGQFILSFSSLLSTHLNVFWSSDLC